MNHSVRRLTRCAVLTALALAISVCEGLVPLTVLIPLPGLRLGLANLVTVYALCILSSREALAILVSRCLLSALVGGNLTALAFSLTGGVFALLTMWALLHFRGFSLFGVCIAGAAAHNAGQILAAIAVLDKQAPSHSELPTFDDIYGRFEPLRELVAVSADSVACILPTSGTTGKPKQSMLTHNNILFSERVFVEGLERTADDVMWMPAPLNHAVGFFHGLVAPMLLGGRSVLMQDFAVKDAIDLINAEGATWSMCSTPFIYDIVKYLDAHSDESLPTYVLHSCGGAPVPGALIDRAHNHDILLCEIFGSTESCPHVFVPPSKCVEWNGDWSGIPFPGIEVRYIDEQGNDVAPGVQGEHISRGPHQFVGYLNEPERTDRALTDDGWWFSGDLGYMDEDGRIRINGRRKEIIIRGGENLSAREIDDNLVGCPGVGESATIGMPDDRLGERICTFVAPLGDIVPTLESVTAYLEGEGVPKRLWPERIEIIDEIPVTATGKVKRFILAQILKERMEAE